MLNRMDSCNIHHVAPPSPIFTSQARRIGGTNTSTPAATMTGTMCPSPQRELCPCQHERCHCQREHLHCRCELVGPDANAAVADVNHVAFDVNAVPADMNGAVVDVNIVPIALNYATAPYYNLMSAALDNQHKNVDMISHMTGGSSFHMNFRFTQPIT